MIISASYSLSLQYFTITPLLQCHHINHTGNSTRSLLISILFIIVPITLLFLFFTSIYLGTAFLQEHISTEEESTSFLSVGLPNTRNKIRKWSVDHLHGIDITSLGPPVVAHGAAPPGGSNSTTTASIYHPSLSLSTSDYYSRLLQKGHNITGAATGNLRGFFHLNNSTDGSGSLSSLMKFAPPFFHAKLSTHGAYRHNLEHDHEQNEVGVDHHDSEGVQHNGGEVETSE